MSQNPVDVLEKLLRDNGCEIDEEAFAEAKKLMDANARECDNPAHQNFLDWAAERIARTTMKTIEWAKGRKS